MSDKIPFDTQVEIMKRLHLKSLVQLRSVSKSWKSLIDSSDFNAHYSRHHAHLQRLVVSSLIDRSGSRLFGYKRKKKDRYVSIIDDDTFSPRIVYQSKPQLVKILDWSSIIGSDHGLLCLFGDCRKGCGSISGESMAVLWNISIRKTVVVVVPNMRADMVYKTSLGFGVCRETSDPKIVKITYIRSWEDMESISCIRHQVEVFTLNTGVWRSSYSNLPRESIHFGCFKVVMKGFLYWLATDITTIDGAFTSYNLIISIDMTTEEFREVTLPDTLAHRSDLSMFKLRESLVVVESGVEADNSVFSVWMMEDGVPTSFTKLFNFNVNKPDASTSIQLRGFRKSGEPIIEITKNNRGQLVVYGLYSKRIDTLLGINGNEGSFSVFTCMETLLLLDKPDGLVYNKWETFKFENEQF